MFPNSVGEGFFPILMPLVPYIYSTLLVVKNRKMICMTMFNLFADVTKYHR